MKPETGSAPDGSGLMPEEAGEPTNKNTSWLSRAWRWLTLSGEKPKGKSLQGHAESEGERTGPSPSSGNEKAEKEDKGQETPPLSMPKTPHSPTKKSPSEQEPAEIAEGNLPAPGIPMGNGPITAETEKSRADSPILPSKHPATLLLQEALGRPGTEAEQKLARQLVLHEVDGMLARALFTDLERLLSETRRHAERDVFLTAARILMRWTPVTGPLQVRPGSLAAVAFIGPTGVGKTTMIARLAAIAAHKEKQTVGLLTTDTHRVAAVEQMKVFARVLSLPLAVVRTRSDMEKALKSFARHDIVFVDTAGQSPNEHERLHELEALLSADATIRRHLVMSATTRHRDVQTILQRFEPIGYDGLVLTKLDESLSYGLLVNAPYWSGRPLVYFGIGQNVPADVEVATQERIADLILDLSGRFRRPPGD